jgi:hypothetical protein
LTEAAKIRAVLISGMLHDLEFLRFAAQPLNFCLKLRHADQQHVSHFGRTRDALVFQPSGERGFADSKELAEGLSHRSKWARDLTSNVNRIMPFFSEIHPLTWFFSKIRTKPSG